MNILITTPWYPTELNQISGTFVREQAVALQKAGHRVTVIIIKAFSKKEIFNKRRLAKERRDEINVYYYTAPSLVKGLFNHSDKMLYFDNRGSLREAIKENGEFDLIHSHVFFPSGVVSSYYKEKLKLPLVLTEHYSKVHNLETSKSNNPVLNKLLQKAVDESDVFVCVSDSLKQAVRQQVKTTKEIFVVPNVLSDEFCPSTKERTDKDYTFVTIGNLIPSKNIFAQLKALQRMPSTNKLRIIGDGYLYQVLEEYIRKNGLDSRVTLYGRVSRSKTAELLRSSDCFLMTSQHETFAVSIIEALASGIPVISTLCGGPDEIIKTSYGAEGIISGDQDELIKKMLTVQCKKFDKKRISQEAKERFGQQAFINNIEKVYNTVLKEGNNL